MRPLLLLAMAIPEAVAYLPLPVHGREMRSGRRNVRIRMAGGDGGNDDGPVNERRPIKMPRMVSWGLNSRSQPSARKALGSSTKKETTVYVCEVCGSEHVQWVGRCPTCREWNSVKAFRVQRGPGSRMREARQFAAVAASAQQAAAPQHGSATARNWVPPDLSSYGVPSRLTDVTTEECQRRIAVPGAEFSRVLGGGLVIGSVVMVGGDPGVGKSTLLLQLAGQLAAAAGAGSNRASEGDSEGAFQAIGPVVYVSGEESVSQVAARALRLGIKEPELFILCETDIEAIATQVAAMQPRPSLLVVDSIQTMRCSDLPSSPGSVTQVRECASQLVYLAKGTGVTVMLVGHVTKSGDIAGPRVVEHMVDAVLYLEGDRLNAYRLLRSVKNRFGSSNEVGVFEMQAGGMAEVANPSRLFMSTVRSAGDNGEAEHLDGTAVMVTMEGTRPLICELQALVTYSRQPSPRRTADGVGIQRLLLLLAVLQKRLGYDLQSREVYLNVVGGLRVQDTAADLAVAVAAVSSYTGVPTKQDACFIGEIGLGGELRMVQQLDRRIKEAAKFGFSMAIVPAPAAGSAQRSLKRAAESGNIEVVQCRTLKEAMLAGLSRAPPPPRRGSSGRQRSRREERELEGEENEDGDGFGAEEYGQGSESEGQDTYV